MKVIITETQLKNLMKQKLIKENENNDFLQRLNYYLHNCEIVPYIELNNINPYKYEDYITIKCNNNEILDIYFSYSINLNHLRPIYDKATYYTPEYKSYDGKIEIKDFTITYIIEETGDEYENPTLPEEITNFIYKQVEGKIEEAIDSYIMENFDEIFY